MRPLLELAACPPSSIGWLISATTSAFANDDNENDATDDDDADADADADADDDDDDDDAGEDDRDYSLHMCVTV